MSNVVLQAKNVSKRYVSYASNLARLRSWFGAAVSPTSEFWAVRDVSFNLERGEAVALIGQNGAGKSTLLKLITGTVRPSTGSVAVAGRVSAILELGLGFNHELTGRQNVFQAGGLMGFSRDQIENLMQDIEDFAELGDFFDKPLRVYSSGMHARLAFSLVTASRPDVLIVDEVLSVGDSYFQHKSFDKIRKFKEEGVAILFVSHSMGDVRALCDRVLLLDAGNVIVDGHPDHAVDYYNAMIAEKDRNRSKIEQKIKTGGWQYTRSGNYAVRAKKVELLDNASGELVSTAIVGQSLRLHVTAVVEKFTPKLVLGIMLRDRTGHVVWGTNTWHTKQVLTDVPAGSEVEFTVNFPCNLGPGSYSITLALTGSDTHLTENFDWQDNALVFDVVNAGKNYFIGSSHLPAEFTAQVTR